MATNTFLDSATIAALLDARNGQSVAARCALSTHRRRNLVGQQRRSLCSPGLYRGQLGRFRRAL